MDRKRDLEACLVIVTGLLVIYFFSHRTWLLVAAAVIGLTGVFLVKPAALITWLWYKIAEIPGAIVSKILLSAVYFLFLCPVALLYRLTRRGRPGIQDGKEGSMWKDRAGHTYTAKDMADPW